MRKFRNLLLGTAVPLALGIGGGPPINAADAANAANPGCTPFAPRTAESPPAGDELLQSDSRWAQQQLRKDDIRWAQTELRYRGLYKGSLDGVLGSGTRRALGQFQRENGLSRTALLDAQTWEMLTDDGGSGVGSSIVPGFENNGSVMDSRVSGLGR